MTGANRTRAYARSRRAAALLAGAALTAGLAAAAHAQTPAETAEADTVTVWGTQVFSSSLFIGEDEIAMRQADHLSDLLRVVPGVEIGGTHSVNQRINFRGLDDRDLQIFIDGALQTNYLFHHLGNLLINPDILKSADLQLGTNTLTHGGLGGSVRFETKDAADFLAGAERPVGARLMGSYNTNDQVSGSLTTYAQFGQALDAIAYYNVVDRDNFEDGSGTPTIGSDGRTENALFKIGVTPADNQRLEFSYELVSDEGDYTQRPDMGVRTNLAIQAGDVTIPTEYDRETMNASHELDLGPALRLETTVFANNMTLWRDERGVSVRGSSGTIREASSDNYGLNVLAVSEAGWGGVDHEFTYGVEYFDQNLTYHPDLIAGAAAVEEDATSLALFVEDRITLPGEFVLRPGARFNNYEQTIEATNSSDEWDDIALGLAAEFPVTDSLRLLASYTELFKGPELAEPFIGGAANKIVNPDLEPEQGDNIEAGFRFTQEVGPGVLNLGANVFRTRIENYIGEVAVPGSATGEVWDANRGTAEITGGEASAFYAVGQWDFLVTYAGSELDDSDLAFDDTTESLREIGDTVGTEVSYSVPGTGLKLTYTGLFVMEQEASGGQIKESYDVHNIGARWVEPGGFEGLVVTAGVDNLFDAFYTSHASRTGFTNHPVFGPLELNDVEPGRNIKVTLAQSF